MTTQQDQKIITGIASLGGGVERYAEVLAISPALMNATRVSAKAAIAARNEWHEANTALLADCTVHGIQVEMLDKPEALTRYGMLAAEYIDRRVVERRLVEEATRLQRVFVAEAQAALESDAVRDDLADHTEEAAQRLTEMMQEVTDVSNSLLAVDVFLTLNAGLRDRVKLSGVGGNTFNGQQLTGDALARRAFAIAAALR